ncbi:MAG: murein biosynthesis integral membrane protein MurJ [Planctomycetes bacterium]|nr:murein biosynthesis integral membrane protein MurJ [Planctomycetota bacterium]
MSERPTILRSAKLIAICTLLSRITGLLRDMLLAHAFGQTRIADAFNFAFQIPNIFRRLFGEGALTAVFVPTFTRTLEKDGKPAAWMLLARTATLLTATLTGIIVLIEAVLLVIWQLRGGNDSLVLSLTALMLPFMLSICLLALYSSYLNCVDQFVPGALASIVLNVAMIAGIVWLGPMVGGQDPGKQVYGVAASVLIAGVLQLVFVWPALRSSGVRLRWDFQPRDPTVRKMIAMMTPILVGQGALMLSTYFDAQVCLLLTRDPKLPAGAGLFGGSIQHPLSAGALTALTNAQRLYQFPLGVLVISLATAALPAFSRLALQGDWKPWSQQVRTLLRLAVFEGLLAGAVMVAGAEPIVRLLFEYGRFDAVATERASRVLVGYGAGMAAFCASHIMLRAYYSFDDVRTPLRISLVALPINFVLSLVLVWFEPLRETAFAISSAATSVGSVVAGLWILHRRTPGGLIDREMLHAILRMFVAAALAAGAIWFGRAHWCGWMDAAAPGRIFSRGADTALTLCVGAAVYIAASWALRLGEPAMLLRSAGSGKVRSA